MGDRRPFSGRVFAGVVLVAMLLMAPSLIWGPPVLDSGAFNYSWTQQFGEALARGEFYPRFFPGSYMVSEALPSTSIRPSPSM